MIDQCLPHLPIIILSLSFTHLLIPIPLFYYPYSTCIGCAAQFWPGNKYPSNYWFLVSCIASYIVLTIIFTSLVLLDRDAIAYTKQGIKGDTNNNNSTSSNKPALVIATKLPRFEETFTLKVACHGDKFATNAAKEGDAAVVIKKSVGTYFTSNGFLVASVIEGDLKKALLQVEKEAKKTK